LAYENELAYLQEQEANIQKQRQIMMQQKQETEASRQQIIAPSKRQPFTPRSQREAQRQYLQESGVALGELSSYEKQTLAPAELQIAQLKEQISSAQVQQSSEQQDYEEAKSWLNASASGRAIPISSLSSGARRYAIDMAQAQQDINDQQTKLNQLKSSITDFQKNNPLEKVIFDASGNPIGVDSDLFKQSMSWDNYVKANTNLNIKAIQQAGGKPIYSNGQLTGAEINNMSIPLANLGSYFNKISLPEYKQPTVQIDVRTGKPFGTLTEAYPKKDWKSWEGAFTNIGYKLQQLKATKPYQEVMASTETLRLIPYGFAGVLTTPAEPIFNYIFDVGAVREETSQPAKLYRGGLALAKFAALTSNPITSVPTGVYYGGKIIQGFFQNPADFLTGVVTGFKEEPYEFVGAIVGGWAGSKINTKIVNEITSYRNLKSSNVDFINIKRDYGLLGKYPDKLPPTDAQVLASLRRYAENPILEKPIRINGKPIRQVSDAEVLASLKKMSQDEKLMALYPQEVKFGWNDVLLRQWLTKEFVKRGADYNKLSEIDKAWIEGQVKLNVRNNPSRFLSELQKETLKTYDYKLSNPENLRNYVLKQLDEGIRNKPTLEIVKLNEQAKSMREKLLPEQRMALDRFNKNLEAERVSRAIDLALDRKPIRAFDLLKPMDKEYVLAQIKLKLKTYLEPEQRLSLKRLYKNLEEARIKEAKYIALERKQINLFKLLKSEDKIRLLKAIKERLKQQLEPEQKLSLNRLAKNMENIRLNEAKQIALTRGKIKPFDLLKKSEQEYIKGNIKARLRNNLDLLIPKARRLALEKARGKILTKAEQLRALGKKAITREPKPLDSFLVSKIKPEEVVRGGKQQLLLEKPEIVKEKPPIQTYLIRQVEEVKKPIKKPAQRFVSLLTEQKIKTIQKIKLKQRTTEVSKLRSPLLLTKTEQVFAEKPSPRNMILFMLPKQKQQTKTIQKQMLVQKQVFANLLIPAQKQQQKQQQVQKQQQKQVQKQLQQYRFSFANLMVSSVVIPKQIEKQRQRFKTPPPPTITTPPPPTITTEITSLLIRQPREKLKMIKKRIKPIRRKGYITEPTAYEQLVRPIKRGQRAKIKITGISEIFRFR